MALDTKDLQVQPTPSDGPPERPARSNRTLLGWAGVVVAARVHQPCWRSSSCVTTRHTTERRHCSPATPRTIPVTGRSTRPRCRGLATSRTIPVTGR